MKRNILLTTTFACAAVILNATVLYVKHDGSGNGTSWQDALGDLSVAIFLAQAGDEIWVAQGTYHPTNDPKNRKASFAIPSGVKVFGGFVGNETTVAQRDFRRNKTILNGNIGSEHDYADNSYTVVLLKNADEHTLLDGFIIAGGTANGTGASADPERSGAGMYIDGSGEGNRSNPVIQNCVFQDNFARDGAAVYLNGRGGECNPSFRNCEFHNNKVDLDGGAVFNDGRHRGMANPSFVNCIFSGNQGNYGGAICNYGGKGASNPDIRNCVFRNNEAYLRGGAIFNMDVDGEARPVINDCQFIDNQSVAGEQVYTFSKMQQGRNAVRADYKMN